MIDSGAEISLLKDQNIIDFFPRSNEKCYISGVTNGRAIANGAVYTDILIGNARITQKFYIIPNNFPINCEAILGVDFLRRYAVQLDYLTNKLTIQRPYHITIPFSDKSNDLTMLPSRAQIFRALPFAVERDYVVRQKEIATGVFIASTILSERSPYVRILNTNNEPTAIDLSKVEFDPLSDYDVMKNNGVDDVKLDMNLNKILKDTPEFAQDKLATLLNEFKDVFASDKEKLPANNLYKQHIRLSDNIPVYKRNYRTPHAHKEIVDEKVKEMLRDGIIEPSQSPYNSPILLVPKKSLDGKPNWRLVIDYRELNKKVIADKYPLPRIEDALDSLGRCKYFGICDLKMGFYQVELDEASRDLTSFSTEQGSFRFLRSPFGLRTSPPAFCRMISLVCAGLSPKTAFIYMDDIIILGNSVNHHLKNIKSIFEVCRKHNLKLNAEKCKFFQTAVTFLGHKCTKDGVLPDSSKFDMIKNYPRPKNKDEVRRFVAMCNYWRRFCRNFSAIAAPLNHLTKRKTPFVWTDLCEENFLKIKKLIMSPQILQYPDFEKEFIIISDASEKYCGAMLAQNYNGIDLPVAFFSKNFTSGEKNKPTIEKELLGIYFAIQHFKPYIYGRKFTVKSDAKALLHLMTLKNPSSRLSRIRLELEEYDFHVEYIPGRENVVADALSRIDISSFKETQVAVTTRLQAKKLEAEKAPNINTGALRDENIVSRPQVIEVLNGKATAGLPVLKFSLVDDLLCEVSHSKELIFEFPLSSFVENQKLNLEAVFERIEQSLSNIEVYEMKLYKDDEIFKHFKYPTIIKAAEKALKLVHLVITPPLIKIYNEEEQLELIKRFHDDPILGGHCGATRLLSKLKSIYHWKKMAKQVNNYVKNCQKCQLNKVITHNKPLSIITPTPRSPFDTIIFDLVGQFETSEDGNKYAITIQCELTKYVIIIPIPNKEAITVAKNFIDHVILVYGPSRIVRTDCGSEFCCEVFSKITELFSIEHSKSVPYHPQSIGPLERNHRVLNSYLKMYMNETGSNWDKYAKYYAFHWNISPIPQLNDYTPFELVFNRKANIPGTLLGPIEPLYNMDDLAKLTQYRFKLSHAHAKSQIEKLKSLQTDRLNQKAKPISFKIGEKVLITNEGRKKNDPFYSGPYEIIDIDFSNVKLKIKNDYKLVHKDRLKKYYSNS